MRVFFLPEAQHVLRLEAEGAGDFDVLGRLYLFGPLQAAVCIRKPLEVGGQLLCALDWDTRGCPPVGAARSDSAVSADQAAREIGSGLRQLIGLALRDLHRDGLIQPAPSNPHAHVQQAKPQSDPAPFVPVVPKQPSPA